MALTFGTLLSSQRTSAPALPLSRPRSGVHRTRPARGPAFPSAAEARSHEVLVRFGRSRHSATVQGAHLAAGTRYSARTDPGIPTTGGVSPDPTSRRGPGTAHPPTPAFPPPAASAPTAHLAAGTRYSARTSPQPNTQDEVGGSSVGPGCVRVAPVGDRRTMECIRWEQCPGPVCEDVVHPQSRRALHPAGSASGRLIAASLPSSAASVSAPLSLSWSSVPSWADAAARNRRGLSAEPGTSPHRVLLPCAEAPAGLPTRASATVESW